MKIVLYKFADTTEINFMKSELWPQEVINTGMLDRRGHFWGAIGIIAMGFRDFTGLLTSTKLIMGRESMDRYDNRWLIRRGNLWGRFLVSVMLFLVVSSVLVSIWVYLMLYILSCCRLVYCILGNRCAFVAVSVTAAAVRHTDHKYSHTGTPHIMTERCPCVSVVSFSWASWFRCFLCRWSLLFPVHMTCSCQRHFLVVWHLSVCIVKRALCRRVCNPCHTYYLRSPLLHFISHRYVPTAYVSFLV